MPSTSDPRLASTFSPVLAGSDLGAVRCHPFHSNRKEVGHMPPQSPLTRPPAESHSSIALVLLFLFALNTNGAAVDEAAACLSTLTHTEISQEVNGEDVAP
ncbi:hypothetical protein [Cellulosimicrobium sp. NPDC057862]|uniref:hypothetical protein n=1 Tax=Actinomycetes TaxID=1760 RepID=UPI00366D6494